MKPIAYGYGPDHFTGPRVFVHPKCRDTFVKRNRIPGVDFCLINAVMKGYDFKGKVCAECQGKL